MIDEKFVVVGGAEERNRVDAVSEFEPEQNEYMGRLRTMTYTTDDLANARRLATEAEGRVAAQHHLITRFEMLGYDTAEDVVLLNNFVQSFEQRVARRDVVEMQLGGAKRVRGGPTGYPVSAL